jgi:hypothetical protein
MDGEQILIEKYIETMTPSAPGWSVSKLADNSLIFGTHGARNVSTAPLVSQTDTWIHVVARRGGSAGSIFTNGVLAGTGSLPFDLDCSSSLKFGHRGDPTDTPGSVDTRGFFLNGRIDEVTIFGCALADSEIAAIYGAGSLGMCGSGWRFLSAQVTNQIFAAQLAGWPTQATLDLERSTNLVDWSWIETRAATNGAFWFTHPAPATGPVEFYRARVR